MRDALRAVLEQDDRLAYALLFGSVARGDATAHSDVDVAVAFHAGIRLAPLELGALVAGLEAAVGTAVDLVDLGHASPALAYRAFRDGEDLIIRDRAAFVERKARAIVEYLDFKPVEQRCARGVLAVAAGGR